MSLWWAAALFLLMMLLRTPVFVALGIVTAICFASITPSPGPELLAQQMFTITEKSELLAIPFFVFAAVLMTRGQSARRIVDVIRGGTDRLPGGLAVATIVSCIFFAAMCGLTPTAVVAVGSLMLPGLVAAKYPPRFSLGLVTSAGSLGILVPPSLVVLVFVVVATSTMQGYHTAAQEAALIREQQHQEQLDKQHEQQAADEQAMDFMPAWASDVQKDLKTPEAKTAEKKAPEKPQPETTAMNIKNMFLAGVAPVMLVAGLFSLFSVVVAKRSGALRERFSASGFGAILRQGAPALVLPILIIYVIFTGKMSVTQAAAMTAVYALVLEIIIFRAVHLRDLPGVFRETGAIVGMILIILAVTIAFNYYLANELVIVDLTEFIKSHFHSRIAFLLAVNVLLLILGCFMDILSAVFVTVPLLLPAAMELGVDPVHFGIIFILNFEIGYLTPPIGVNLFTAGAVFRKDLLEVSRSVLPFLALLLAALLLVTYYPALSLWLVHAAG